MKISVCSDIHLEFGRIDLKNIHDAEVLVLSGDVCVASQLDSRSDFIMGYGTMASEKSHAFFDMVTHEFDHVIYIAGNHEHYHGDFAKTHERLRQFLDYSNLHILDKEIFEYKDVTFIGGTLWTDMNKGDPMTIHTCHRGMNDYAYRNSNVTNQEGRALNLSPADTMLEHELMLKVIKETIQNRYDRKFVVCTHHAPTHLSTHPRYLSENLMNGAYRSDLSELILDNPQIKLWTHGHTHDGFDYMMGSTRVLCNPRGYFGYEFVSDSFVLHTVEV